MFPLFVAAVSAFSLPNYEGTTIDISANKNQISSALQLHCGLESFFGPENNTYFGWRSARFGEQRSFLCTGSLPNKQHPAETHYVVFYNHDLAMPEFVKASYVFEDLILGNPGPRLVEDFSEVFRHFPVAQVPMPGVRWPTGEYMKWRVPNAPNSSISFDRGHVLSDALTAIKGPEARLSSHIVTNIVPQQWVLNQGCWRAMEHRIVNYIKTMAQNSRSVESFVSRRDANGDLYLVVGAVVQNRPQRVFSSFAGRRFVPDNYRGILHADPTVPEAMFMVVCDNVNQASGAFYLDQSLFINSARSESPHNAIFAINATGEACKYVDPGEDIIGESAAISLSELRDKFAGKADMNGFMCPYNDEESFARFQNEYKNMPEPIMFL